MANPRNRTPIRGRDNGKRETSHRKERERNLRAAARRAPQELFGYLRAVHDGPILTLKAEMASEGRDRTHVLRLAPDPSADPGERMFVCIFSLFTRETWQTEVDAVKGTPDDLARLAEITARLAGPPQPGHVWLLASIPGHWLLWEEPVALSVPPARFR